MDKGKILAEGTPSEIFSDEKLLLSAGLDVPEAVRIAARLRKNGVPLREDILTEEDLIDSFIEVMNS